MSVFEFELEHICQELAQRLRCAVPSEAFAIALADEGSTRLRAVHAVGYADSGAALEERLRAHGLEALATGRVLMHRTAGGQELTAPMFSSGGAAGTITVLVDDVDAPEQLTSAQHALVDIAEHGATEIEHARRLSQVERRERLETIADVVTGVANELRNPLFGISSAAQLLRFRAREDPVLERNIGRILREVERLNGMVSDLLEYGNARSLALVPGDPDRVWDEVLNEQRGLLESRSLVVQRNRGEHPADCDLDHAQLSRALVGVLAHVVEATPSGGDLTITSTLRPRGGWRCTIHSAGMVIPADALPRVFEIFSPVHQRASGVGLALVRRIIEEHGGAIGVESSAERGTTISIALPGTTVKKGEGAVRRGVEGMESRTHVADAAS